jgi:hypothetical protein
LYARHGLTVPQSYEIARIFQGFVIEELRSPRAFLGEFLKAGIDGIHNRSNGGRIFSSFRCRRNVDAPRLHRHNPVDRLGTAGNLGRYFCQEIK